MKTVFTIILVHLIEKIMSRQDGKRLNLHINLVVDIGSAIVIIFAVVVVFVLPSS